MPAFQALRLISIAALAAALCGCDVESIRESFDKSPPARIAGVEIDEFSNVRLQISFSAPVSATIQASELSGDVLDRGPWRDVVVGKDDVATWTDDESFSANVPGARYYRLRVSTGDGDWISREIWAVFSQPREPNQRYLVSIPVDLGADNRLDGLLGQQLAIGMHPGQSTNDADLLQYFTDAGTWRQLYLQAVADGAPQWTDPDKDLPSTLAIPPGRAFWLIRQGGPGFRLSHGLFWGPIYATPHPVTFRADVGQGTPFGLTLSYPLRHHREIPAGWQGNPYDPLGFAAVGSGGSTSDHHQTDEVGDQIWIWKNNEWQGYYWLIGHKGPAWDGRWWDNRTRDFAEFALEPGQGYYYRHRPNRWGGRDFKWSPPLAAENLDSE